jgi:phage regulator Rha-like protein
MCPENEMIPIERIENKIFFIRSEKVMLDSDLAELFGVETKNLNRAVKRNLDRFPSEFMFQLKYQELAALRFQIGTSNDGRGGRRTLPYAFTEHGTIMLATVLNSHVAVQTSIQIVKAFVRLRQLLSTHKDLARKLTEMENKYDVQFRVVFDAIRELMAPPVPKRRKIGFRRDNEQ